MSKKKKKKARKEKKADKKRLPEQTSDPDAPRFDFSNPTVFAAATVTLGIRYMKDYDLGDRDPKEALEKMGLPTEGAEDAADAMEQLVIESRRGPGRPRKSTEEKLMHHNTEAVMQAVTQFVIHNPGCVYRKHERRVYNDDFKSFVLEMLDEGGLAHGMTARQAAHAIGVSLHTLNSWLAARRRADSSEPDEELPPSH